MDNPVAPGDVFLGKYRVERVLGKGGMGVVVAVRHVDLGQLYAIKFLLPAMLGHRESLERFLREARAAARLQSEHVAKVHDVGRMENGAPYMVLEYLDGCDLKVWLGRQGPLSVEEAVAYVLQVCDAIAEAHELGIVHRDLKPANLFLVRRRNGTPCVKVLDFGISKHTGPEDVELTSTNAMFGSPLYMSPEQMARTKTVDSRTDIWAIGTILYELLTGKSPFKATTMTEVVSRVLQEEPVPLRELRPDVPPGLEAVIARCLRKRREERFQTVGELVDAISPFGMVLSARAPMATGANLEATAGLGRLTQEGATIPLPQSAVIDGSTAKPLQVTQPPATNRTVGPVALVVIAATALLLGGSAIFFFTRGASAPAPAAGAAASSTSPPTSAPALVAVSSAPNQAPTTVEGGNGTAPTASPSAAPKQTTATTRSTRTKPASAPVRPVLPLDDDDGPRK